MQDLNKNTSISDEVQTPANPILEAKVAVKNTVADIMNGLWKEGIGAPGETKIHIEGSREKKIHEIKVIHIDEDRFMELHQRFIHNKCTKKESIYVRSVARALDLSKAVLSNLI